MSIPADLIHEIRTHLRARAGLPNYDPSSMTITSLPSLEESISNFDNSSDSTNNVRCKSCKGKLLRGASSVICVYCGEEQFSVREENNVILPESLKFRETVGFKWLLGALKLDGSETVGPSIGEIQSRRGPTSNENELSVSDLLDLEIKWEGDLRRDATYFRNNSTTQDKSSPNLAGVNLDSFFAEANKDPILNASRDDLAASTQKQSNESGPFDVHESVSLFENVQIANTSVQSFENVQLAETSVRSFENVQPSQTSIRSTEGEIVDRFSGWEAEFQSTSSGHEGSSSFGAFGSSGVDLSMHMDAVFGSEKDLENKLADLVSSAPMTNSGSEDDVWSNFNSGVSSDQATSRVEDGSAQDQINTPTINDDLIKGLQQQPSGSKVPNSDAIDVNDDSFDDWNDFTSSSTSERAYNSSSAQNFDQSLSSAKQSEEVNLSSSGNTFSNTGRGNSLNTDFFTDSFGDPNNFMEANNLMSEPSPSVRSTSYNVNEEKPSEQDRKGEDNADANARSKVDYVEMLMSQMHDLSFMLESDLSVPKS